MGWKAISPQRPTVPINNTVLQTSIWAREELEKFPPPPLSSHERKQQQAELIANQQLLSELTQTIHRQKVILSLQRHLCPELLSEVFSCLADMQGQEFSFPRFDQNPPAIMTVCHRWRQIALHTTSLFRLIVIDYDSLLQYGETLEPAPFVHGLNRRLSRGQDVSLTVHLSLQTLDDLVDAIWPPLCRNAHRWKTFDWNFVPVSPPSSLFQLLSLHANASRLQTLKIGSPYAAEEHDSRLLASLATPLKFTMLTSLHLEITDTTVLFLFFCAYNPRRCGL